MCEQSQQPGICCQGKCFFRLVSYKYSLGSKQQPWYVVLLYMTSVCCLVHVPANNQFDSVVLDAIEQVDKKYRIFACIRPTFFRQNLVEMGGCVLYAN